MTEFKELGLSEPFLKVLESLKFTQPTQIQEKTIPLALQGKDIIGGSATGSGKTLAFGASIIENIKPNGGTQALIITPTRELAEQVGKSLRTFARFKRVNISMVYGGVSIRPQINKLTQSDIVVGTPGRILDHLERRTIDLSRVQALVLDEADRMLDMGFINDVEMIISKCPRQRQTFLFSATISSDISHLARKYMNNPVEIAVESYVDASKLKQIYYDVQPHQKISLLVHLLKKEKTGLVMVFCNTRHMTDSVAQNLKLNDIDAMAIHGGFTQAKRNSILEHFHSGSVVVLVCTDVAARGLDIKNVSHVYNYDIPPNSKEYVHRIGRTARAGNEGTAISIVARRDYENFQSVLRDRSLNIDREEVPEMQAVRVQMQKSRGFGGGDGGPRRFGNRDGGNRGGYARADSHSNYRDDSRPPRRFGGNRGGGQGASREGSQGQGGFSGGGQRRRFNDGPQRYSRNR